MSVTLYKQTRLGIVFTLNGRIVSDICKERKQKQHDIYNLLHKCKHNVETFSL